MESCFATIKISKGWYYSWPIDRLTNCHALDKLKYGHHSAD